MPGKVTPKVLIVDDTPANLAVLENLLAGENCQLIKAESGEQALSRIKDHDFAVILLDMQTPLKDGFETAELIRGIEKSKNVPIIFITPSSKEQTYVFKGYELGVVDFLYKPLDEVVLISKVNAFLKFDTQRRELEEEIAHRKAVENELEKARIEASVANKAKSEFLANMTHEIRTPMNAVLGYAQILQGKNLAGDDKTSVDRILSSGNHLLALINDILDFSKMETGKTGQVVEDFDLTEMIRFLVGVFTPKCKSKGLIFEVKGIPKEHIWVKGDETKIRQILINLLRNAAKFTSAGKVSLEITSGKQDQYKFDVVDTGKGIPVESQKSIFEVFKQDKEGQAKGGTGLGLAISKKQVEIMGGQLELISELGKGSRFSLILTLAKGSGTKPFQEVMKPDQDVVRLAPGFEVKALVVDDVAHNRDVLAKALSEAGIIVISAENGKEAVDMVRKFVPDIVFMDNHMPLMNGLEATSVIRKEFPCDKIKIVAITASVSKKESRLNSNTQVDALVGKPFRVEEIFECIKRLLNVEFEYKDSTHPDEPNSPEIDLSKVNIPEKIIEPLKNAAELYMISAFEKALKELENESSDGRALANYIKPMFVKYDLKGVYEILQKVGNGESDSNQI